MNIKRDSRLVVYVLTIIFGIGSVISLFSLYSFNVNYLRILVPVAFLLLILQTYYIEKRPDSTRWFASVALMMLIDRVSWLLCAIFIVYLACTIVIFLSQNEKASSKLNEIAYMIISSISIKVFFYYIGYNTRGYCFCFYVFSIDLT